MTGVTYRLIHIYTIVISYFYQLSLWRNWLARSAVNRKVGGSSPPRDVITFEHFDENKTDIHFDNFCIKAHLVYPIDSLYSIII